MMAKLARLLGVEKRSKSLCSLDLDALFAEVSEWSRDKDVGVITRVTHLFVDLEDERFRKIALEHSFWEDNADKLCSRERARFAVLMEQIRKRYSDDEWALRQWAFNRKELP